MQLEDLIPPPIEAAPRYPTGPAVDAFLMERGLDKPPAMGASQDIVGNEPIMSAGRPKGEHKGIFGVKGTLRDILGIIGDGLTGNMAYSGLRRQERFGDAARGFQDDPRGSIDALNRAGFAKEAMELYELHQKQQQAAATLARQRANDEITQLSGLNLAQNRATAGIRGLLNSVTDDATYERVLPVIGSILKRNRMEDRLVTLPSTFKGNEDAIRRWGMDPYQQERLVDADERLAVQEELGKERIATTRRGQDIASSDRRRGQDMTDARVRGSAGYTGQGKKGGSRRTPPPPPPGMKWVKKSK